MVTFFNYVINTMYIYSRKTNEKHLTYFGDPLCKNYFFLIARGVQLDNGVDPPPVVLILKKVKAMDFFFFLGGGLNVFHIELGYHVV